MCTVVRSAYISYLYILRAKHFELYEWQVPERYDV